MCRMPTTSPNGKETDNLKPPRGKRRCHFLFIPPNSHSSNNQPYAFPPPITVSQPSYSSLPPPLQGKETPRWTEQQWWQRDVTHSQNCKMHGWLLGNNSSVVVGDTQPVTSERRSADLRKHTDTRLLCGPNRWRSKAQIQFPLHIFCQVYFFLPHCRALFYRLLQI